MRTFTVLSIGAALLACTLALLLATTQWGLGSRPWLDGTTRTRWPNLLEDTHDRGVYQQRGRWLPAGLAPYLGEHSEYPELATWMFAAPYLVIEHHVPEGGYEQGRDEHGKRRIAPEELEDLAADQGAYFDAFHGMMALGMLALLAATVANLRALGHAPGWALLLFLPASLYFGFNRYDAVPAAMVSGALLLHLRGRQKSAALVLGLAAMMKWYPILLLPMLCAHATRERRERGEPWGSALVRALIVPGLIAGGVCLAVLGVTFVWNGGGLEAASYVYKHHAARGANQSSILSALTVPERWGLLGVQSQASIASIFTLLQFLPAALLALLPVRSRDALLTGCLLVVTGFVTFSKVFSPQWILWISPLVVLLVPGRPLLLALLVALEFLLYLQVPVLHYGGPAEVDGLPVMMQPLPAFWVVCDLRIATLVALWAWSLAAFVRSVLGRSNAPTRHACAA